MGVDCTRLAQWPLCPVALSLSQAVFAQLFLSTRCPLPVRWALVPGVLVHHTVRSGPCQWTVPHAHDMCGHTVTYTSRAHVRSPPPMLCPRLAPSISVLTALPGVNVCSGLPVSSCGQPQKANPPDKARLVVLHACPRWDTDTACPVPRVASCWRSP